MTDQVKRDAEIAVRAMLERVPVEIEHRSLVIHIDSAGFATCNYGHLNLVVFYMDKTGEVSLVGSCGHDSTYDFIEAALRLMGLPCPELPDHHRTTAIGHVGPLTLQLLQLEMFNDRVQPLAAD